MRKIVVWIVLIYLGIVVPQAAQAQETCPDLVLQAVQTVGTSCGAIGRNSVCYGNYRVDAVLTRPVGSQFFSEPSDQIQLVDVQSLQTAPLDLIRDEWGIAVMNLQANLPQVLPGQVVTLLLLGDAQIQNDAPIPAENLPTITTLTNTALYSQPDATVPVLAPLESNVSLQAFGITADNQWLHIALSNLYGWVRAADTDANLAALQLPVVDGQTPLPMQAFTFRAAVGGPRCAEAPPSVLVMQGPEAVRVSLTVNGAQMELGSTVALWQPEDTTLQLAVIDGQVDFEDGTTIPGGSTTTVIVDETGQVAGEWAAPRPLSVFEIADLLPLENLPDNLLNYPINVIEEGEIVATVTSSPTFVPTRPPFRPTLTPTPLPPTSTPAPIVSFTADAESVYPGDCTVLRWNTEHIDSVYINNQPTVGTSSQEVCLRTTQTYMLLVVFRDGTQQAYNITVLVLEVTSTPISTCGNQICEEGESYQTCTPDCQPIIIQ